MKSVSDQFQMLPILTTVKIIFVISTMLDLLMIYRSIKRKGCNVFELKLVVIVIFKLSASLTMISWANMCDTNNCIWLAWLMLFVGLSLVESLWGECLRNIDRNQFKKLNGIIFA
jgi:hypothetical protein